MQCTHKRPFFFNGITSDSDVTVVSKLKKFAEILQKSKLKWGFVSLYNNLIIVMSNSQSYE